MSATILVIFAGCLMLVGLAPPAHADVATLSMSPSHGPPGTLITLSGSGFKHSATVTISYNGAVQTAVLTDTTGVFSMVFNAPNLPPGTYPVTASDGVNSVSVDFKLDPSAGTTSTTSTSTTTTSTTTTTASSPSTVTVLVTTTKTVVSPTTTTVTSTESGQLTTTTQTVVSPTTTTVTSTTSGQLTTATRTQTAPASTVTATSVLAPATSTVTVTASGSQTSPNPGADQNPPQSMSALPDTSLYFFAGVGALILAISLGILAFRRRVNQEYGRGL